ncbi:MAG: amidohydrolase [Burkholderiales bacterium]|nr:amidohydrolase [Burkholderiales bacterium]
MGRYLGAALTGAVGFVNQHHDELTRVRRDLHAHPELGFEEHRTAALVAERLQQWGIEVHTGIGRTGVVGVLRGRVQTSGRSVGLRADMDALPIGEENEFGHRSTRSGLMHACGHDGHTTMLLGAAQYLAATRHFDGTVYLIFQPGEEGYAGAREMIGDGLFERFPADEVYALHNWPGLPAGHIGLNPGPMMAAADRVEIVVRGKGGHGAHPHLTVDPVLVAGHVIAAAQSIVARNVAPLEAAVVSLCAVQAGNLNAFSVVPREARISGTVRAFQHSVQSQIEARLKELVESTARAFGATADVRYQRMYPATINHRPQYEFAAGVAEQLVGQDQVVRSMPPSMGAEDFSFMLQARPGCYARLGQGGGEGCWLHSTRYDFNDAVIPLGAGYLAALAERRLPLATGA